MEKPKYRPEIDGLRALAVAAVICFHAGFSGFSGGFVGVDVFFVISGYLITSIIISEQEAGKFSLVRFYERRARRILPALFLVMAACLPFAWFWLLQGDMKDFADSVAAVSVFGSNILFWRERGYFETAGELKPLLHTWSLAVEEQYYLLFPLVLMYAWRVRRGLLLSGLVLAAVASIAAAHWGAIHKPSATFFLLPTRGWELLVGSFVAFLLAAPRLRFGTRPVAEAASMAGLLMVVAAIVAFDKATPFPSLYALVPTIGTAAILLFATPATLVGKLLGTSILVGVGLVSYSAYLWHQPLFAFARHWTVGEADAPVFAALSMVALGLAYLSWRFVERPFRDSSVISRKGVFIFAATGSCFFLSLGIYGHLQNGFQDRLQGAQAEFAQYFDNSLPEWQYFRREDMLAKYNDACNFYDHEQFRIGSATKVPRAHIAPGCYTRDPARKHAVFIWGDSHAQQLYFGVKNNLPADWQLLQVASSGCTPSLTAGRDHADHCEYSNWFAMRSMRENKPDVVIVAQYQNHDVGDMAEISGALARMGVRKVLFTGPTPHWKADLPKIVLLRLWDNTPRRTMTGVDKSVWSRDERLKEAFRRDLHADYVSLVDYFCNAQGCLTYIGEDKKTGLTSFDQGHLTPVASDAFGRDVLVPSVVNAIKSGSR